MQKIPVEVFPSSQDAVAKLAAETAELIRANDSAGKQTVLGLATGGTPIPYYNELIRLHKEEIVCVREFLIFLRSFGPARVECIHSLGPRIWYLVEVETLYRAND